MQFLQFYFTLNQLRNPAESRTSFSGQLSRFLRLQKLIKRECQLGISSSRFSHPLSFVASGFFPTPKSHDNPWQGNNTQEQAMDWCVQIMSVEDHCNSEIQDQHRAADVTREGTGFSSRIVAKSAGFNTSMDLVVVQPQEHCLSTWLGVWACLERVTCSLPPMANPPLVHHWAQLAQEISAAAKAERRSESWVWGLLSHLWLVGWCENALDPEMEVKQRNYIREFSEEKIQASPTVLRESFWLISMSRHFNRNRNWGKLQQVLVLSTFLYLEAITLTESAHHPAPLPDKWTHELPIWGFSKAKWLSKYQNLALSWDYFKPQSLQQAAARGSRRTKSPRY